MQGVFYTWRLVLTYHRSYAILIKSGNLTKELAMKKNYKALIEAITEGLIIFTAWPWIISLPTEDMGFGNVIFFILMLILGVMLSCRAVYCYGKFARSSNGYKVPKEPAAKKNRTLIEAIIWGVIIVVEAVWFLNDFMIGDEWFNAVLPAVIISIAAMLIRIAICVFRHKNVPLPWEKSSDKDYTALIEAVICIALTAGAPFWINNLPRDTGYGALIIGFPTILICQGLFCRAAYLVYKFIKSMKE